MGVIAYIISYLFLTVFSFSSLAILQCFILDEDFGGSNRTPQSLQGFLSMQEEVAKDKVKPVGGKNDEKGESNKIE